MACSWNKISLGFDPEDETVNFGARVVAESSNSVYDTATVATIQSDSQPTRDPLISATIYHSQLCIAIDKSITIFSDRSCKDIRLCADFDCAITSYLVCGHGSFLLVALDNGTLYCLNLEMGGKFIFSRDILRNHDISQEFIIKMFLRIDENASSYIMPVTSKGQIYKIAGFTEKLMEAVRNEADEARLEALTENIHCSRIFKDDGPREIASADLCISMGVESVALVGRDVVLWPRSQGYSMNALQYSYTKLQYLKHNRLILCLRSDGALNVLCPVTLLAKKVWDGPAVDIVIVKDDVDSSPQILALMRPKTDNCDRFIKLISFPDFQVKYTLKVSTASYLVNFDDGPVDEMVFLEGTKILSTVVDTITVKLIIEKSPDFQLQRLLRRGKYGDAEVFARRFRLDPAAIYSAKVVALVNELNTCASNDDTIRVINEVTMTMDKIVDVRFIYKYCNSTITSNYKQTKSLLSYARERLRKYAQNHDDNENEIPTYLSNLSSSLLRIETFDLMEKIRETSTSDEDKNIRWLKFSRTDLLTECKDHLMTGELEVAALIWVRHASMFAKQITNEALKDLLDIIPETVSQQELWPWLFHFIPSLLSIFPEGLSDIVTWACKKVRSLEKFDKDNWPQCGIDFSRGIIELLNFQESQSFFHLQKQYHREHSPLLRLTNIMQALSDLQHLRTEYRLSMNIDGYMQEPLEVAHSLLHRVHPREVDRFIKSFLTQFLLNHTLEKDNVLILYIQKVLKNSEEWWFWKEAPWEEKITNVIGCIYNLENRLKQTLEVLKKAPVPWSATMLGLVKTSATFNHPLVGAILTERDFVATKLILKKYGYQHVGINKNLFKYIVKQNRTEMMDDLYEMVKNSCSMKTTALVFCVNYFLSKGDRQRMTTVLNSLKDDDALYCCKQIVNYISVCLQFKDMNQSAEYYAEILGEMQHKLRNMLSANNTSDSLFDDTLVVAADLKSLCLLRQEFGILLTLADYQTKTEDSFRTIIQTLYNGEKDPQLVSTICKNSERIAALLCLPQILAICILLEETKSIHVLRHYMERFGRSNYFSAAESRYVTRLCKICIVILQNDVAELGILRNICASALDTCSNGELQQILLTVTWINLGHNIIVDDPTDEWSANRSDTGTMRWKLYNIYTDAAISSSFIVVPFFKDCFKFYLNCLADEKLRGDQEKLNVSLRTLVSRLQKTDTQNLNLSLLQVLVNLISSYSSSTGRNDILPAVQPMLENCLRVVLKKVISARSFDLQLGLSCLCLMEKSDATKWIDTAFKEYTTDYSRLSVICDLGYEHSQLIKKTSRSNYFAYYRICLDWARRLVDYGVHHKEFLTSNTKIKQDILERVMRSKKTGLLDLLKQFCVDFEIDVDECYLLYLEILMKQWTPSISTSTILDGQQELKIRHNEVAAINKACEEIASRIDDKTILRNHLEKIGLQINFYHYEIFELIMKLTGQRNEKQASQLGFFKTYTRIGPPTQIEFDEWSQLSPENNSLPDIAKWRLPFLPKVDQWKLIKSELDLTTYKKWLEVAGVLDLQVHNICSLAIKGGVTRVWGLSDDLKKKKSHWLIHLRNPTLLEEIEKCIRCMSQSDVLTYGTAALYYVVNHTPPGADQAAAAELWYSYAKKLDQISIDSDPEMTEKIKSKYLQLTATHILYTHGLGMDHYLRLIPYPEKLARELYTDESIVTRSRGATDLRPDINSAVKALGQIFPLNITQLCSELLEEWLRPSEMNEKLEESMTYNFSTMSSRVECNTIDDDNLLRACYILELGDKDNFTHLLINIAYGSSDDSNHRPGVRFRALHVLLSITDSETVQAFTKRDLESIKRYMKSLSYVSDLDILGFPFSVESFDHCSKLELVQLLSKRYSHSPRALTLILNLCLDYKLNNYILWDKTLSAMAKIPMVPELALFLPKLIALSYSMECDGYVRGWDVLIFEPFRKADVPMSQAQLDDCIESVSRLHACPVAHKLNLRSIAEMCFRYQHPELAASLLPFLETNNQEFVLETIRKTWDLKKTITNLRAITSKGILTTSYSVHLLEQYDTAN